MSKDSKDSKDNAVAADALVVIPARYESSRFPGKPLVELAGKSMIERVWRIASSLNSAGLNSAGLNSAGLNSAGLNSVELNSVGLNNVDVCIATDDERIAEAAQNFGAHVEMTSRDCRNGSERCAQAFTQFGKKLGKQHSIVINLQGDAPLLPPHVLTELLAALRADAQVVLATPAHALTLAEYEVIKTRKAQGSSSGTFVTFDKNKNALYFSSALIPFLRKAPRGRADEYVPVYKHIGVYAYRAETLLRYVDLPFGDFEELEQLEQLRALEHGIPIRVVLVDVQGRSLASVDNPEDMQTVEDILAREGELFP